MPKTKPSLRLEAMAQSPYWAAVERHVQKLLEDEDYEIAFEYCEDQTGEK